MQLPPLWDPKRFHLIDDPIDLVRRDTQVRLEREKFLLSRHVSCSSSSLISSENNLCNFLHRPPTLHTIYKTWFDLWANNPKNINQTCQNINCVKFSAEIARFLCCSDMFRKRKRPKISPYTLKGKSCWPRLESSVNAKPKRVLLKRREKNPFLGLLWLSNMSETFIFLNSTFSLCREHTH